MLLRSTLILVWRALVLALIGALAFFTTFLLFPWIDNRTPLLVGLLLFYAVVAYVAIPVAIRLLRLILKPNHVPTHVTTGDGWASDPVNIALTVRGSRHLTRAMRAAGWQQADPNTMRNSLREGYALLFNRPYPTAPCSHLYMFGRPQDIAFQIAVGDSPRIRHHVRFWRVEARQYDATSQQLFWWHTLRKMVGLDRELWVGAATFDEHMIGMRWRTLQLTHKISADTNKERDFLIHSLKSTGYMRKVSSLQAGEPYSFRGQDARVKIYSDGSVSLCELRRSPRTRA